MLSFHIMCVRSLTSTQLRNVSTYFGDTQRYHITPCIPDTVIDSNLTLWCGLA